MKNYKYIGLLLLSIGVASCDVNNELTEIEAEVVPVVELKTGDLNFSKYIAIGASFTSGYTDGALFKAAQENSFPNILAGKFGTEFKQPLMADNIGGMTFGGSTVIQEPRFFFNGAGPARLSATPTTEGTTVLTGGFNNFGIPGAKSFHFLAAGLGNLAGVPAQLANPYYARMATSASATILGDALAQEPTFFTVLGVGGNDVLAYALAGGAGVDQKGNLDPSTYGSTDITDPNVYASVFSNMITSLTANGAKGVVANVPYITDLANFITVPYNPIPLDAGTAGAVNSAYALYNGGIKQAFAFLVANTPMTKEMADAEIIKRTINFSAGQNAVVILDEDLTDLTKINARLVNMRQATAADLLVLAGSAFIGTLADPKNPLSVNGVGVPLADKWVITPQEQASIKTATDAYNKTIKAVSDANPNVAFVDFKTLLTQAATTGLQFDDYTMTTNLVTGGLVSLDGVHLTSRGYAFVANQILGVIDAEFGSNFTTATNGLAKANDFPTNYSRMLP